MSCRRTFTTAEVDEEFLDELCELRDALSEIKENAERYVVESESASKSLLSLSKSLDVLRALTIYRTADSSDVSLTGKELTLSGFIDGDDDPLELG